MDDGKLPVVRGVIQRFPKALAEVARVSQLGCIKYSAKIGDMGYLGVEDGIGRYTDAVGRHILAEQIEGPVNTEYGGKLPPDGMKVLHAAQTAWNALARLELQIREWESKGFDVTYILQNPGLPAAIVANEKATLEIHEIAEHLLSAPGLPTTRRVPRGAPLDKSYMAHSLDKCDRHDFGITQEDLGDCDPGC
jgi:hypothetical protein